MKVKVKGLVKATKHNGKAGIVTNVLIPGEEGCRVGVKLEDDSGTILNIKIENLVILRSNISSDGSDRYAYLVARKDGTMHIGSTPEII